MSRFRCTMGYLSTGISSIIYLRAVLFEKIYSNNDAFSSRCKGLALHGANAALQNDNKSGYYAGGTSQCCLTNPATLPATLQDVVSTSLWDAILVALHFAMQFQLHFRTMVCVSFNQLHLHFRMLFQLHFRSVTFCLAAEQRSGLTDVKMHRSLSMIGWPKQHA
jgi:hypothetical protein